MGESSVRANISWSVRRSFENEVTRRCTHTYKHVYSNTSMHTYARTHTKNIHTHTLNTQKQYTHAYKHTYVSNETAMHSAYPIYSQTHYPSSRFVLSSEPLTQSNAHSTLYFHHFSNHSLYFLFSLLGCVLGGVGGSWAVYLSAFIFTQCFLI